MKKNISYWESSANIKSYPRLEEKDDIKVDVVVIGGGMAGICTAYVLKKNGLSVAVLEANQVGHSNTANTTAKITFQHDLCYDRLITHHGAEKAKLYALANGEALELYRKIIKENKIDCDLMEADAYIFAATEKYAKDIDKEKDAVDKLSIPMDIVDTIELPMKIKSAIRAKNQAKFHPLKFIAGLCELVEGDGSYIFEHTMVIDIEDGKKIVTPKGHVSAKYIVVATHYPIINVPGFFFLKMYQHRTQVIGFKSKPLNGIYCSAEKDGFCYRTTPMPDGELMIMDGADYKTGHAGNTLFYDIVEKAAREEFGKVDVLYRWSAQDCMPVDYVPYIGRYSKKTPDMFVATGFQKWGMSTSMVSAKLIADLILDGKSDYEELYNPSRFEPAASAKEFIPLAADAAANLTKSLLNITKDKLSDLKNGEAVVVNIDNQRIGIFKDNDGKEYAIDATCKHLGCALAWNNDEQTWDCPCHGSRYDINGEILESPTVHSLDRVNVTGTEEE